MTRQGHNAIPGHQGFQRVTGSAPETDLDAPSSDRLHFHRNGSGGWPFHCRVHAGRLEVFFDDSEAPGVPGSTPHQVHLEIINAATALPPAESSGRIQVRYAYTEAGTGVTVFDTDADADGEPTTMVAVTDMSAPDTDHRTAVFAVRRLVDGDVAFGSNSWRGDMFHDSVLAALRPRHRANPRT